jgi:hypothetical protein
MQKLGTPNIPIKTDESLVNQYFERITHNPKVVSSSLTPATTKEIKKNSLYQGIQAIFLFFTRLFFD